MRRFPRLPARGFFIGATLSALLLAAFAAPVSAQSLIGKSAAATAPAPNDPRRTRLTVETASRDAQAAIRSCDDNRAILCVANELTKYAEALKQIDQERALQPSTAPHLRQHHFGCLSPHNKPIRCPG